MIKVMHVDNDAAMRDIVDMVLCLTEEFVVMPCQSGEEAIEQLSIFGPEVILIDMMKEMSGAKTIAAIHAIPEFANIPVIFMTSAVLPSEIAELRAAGAVDVISKPLDPQALATRIKNAVPDYA